MPVQVSGFAKGLVRCPDFVSVASEELDGVLEESPETLELDYVATVPADAGRGQ